jgi:hypothetical protein
MKQRLADTFEPVEPTDCRQDMGGVGALPPSGEDPAACFAEIQQSIKESLFGAMGDETRAKLGFAPYDQSPDRSVPG